MLVMCRCSGLMADIIALKSRIQVIHLSRLQTRKIWNWRRANGRLNWAQLRRYGGNWTRMGMVASPEIASHWSQSLSLLIQPMKKVSLAVAKITSIASLRGYPSVIWLLVHAFGRCEELEYALRFLSQLRSLIKGARSSVKRCPFCI